MSDPALSVIFVFSMGRESVSRGKCYYDPNLKFGKILMIN